jgi:hypothetical protein
LNRRAATPNAVKDRDNNAKEDPASGTAGVDHVPGVVTLKPNPAIGSTIVPISLSFKECPPMVVMVPPSPLLEAIWTTQAIIVPVRPVVKVKLKLGGIISEFVMVCTPSSKENACGVTDVVMLAGSGLASVTIAVTKSLVK